MPKWSTEQIERQRKISSFPDKSLHLHIRIIYNIFIVKEKCFYEQLSIKRNGNNKHLRITRLQGDFRGNEQGDLWQRNRNCR